MVAQPLEGEQMMQPRSVALSGVVGEKRLQPEVEPRHVTDRGFFRVWHGLHHTENQPQPVGGIPFDDQRFHRPAQRAVPDVPVFVLANADGVTVQQPVFLILDVTAQWTG